MVKRLAATVEEFIAEEPSDRLAVPETVHKVILGNLPRS